MGAVAPGYQPEGSREVFLTFIMPRDAGGETGLMIAGLLAAGHRNYSICIELNVSLLCQRFLYEDVP